MKKMMKMIVAILVTLICGTLFSAGMKLTEKGILCDTGKSGSFTISYPVLIDSENKQNKILETKVSGRKATIKYAKGGTLKLKLKGKDVTLNFSSVPADTKKFHCSMIIPSSYKDGGTWSIGTDKNKSFPKEKPAKPLMYQGSASDFEIVSQFGVKTSITIPEYSYQQLQDNREWGWQVYQWQFWTPFNHDNPDCTITLSGKTDIKKAGAFRVDRFGQAVKANIVNRVKDEEDLKKDVEREKSYYASFNPPKFDRFGGLLGSSEKMGLKKTDFFHVEKKGERWILVDPDGNAFFHLGVCCFGSGVSYTYIKGRENIFEWIPPRNGNYKHVWNPQPYWNPTSPSFHLANMVRKYNEPIDLAAFQTRMIDRVRKWGFNSIGAFSKTADKVLAKKHFPYVTHLPGAQSWGAIKPLPGIKGSFDVFDEKNWNKYDKLCQAKLAKLADDPLIIGFYLVNEPTHEAIPRLVPTFKNIPVKKRLVKFLEEKYKTIGNFNKAWNRSAVGFPELAGIALPVATKQASKDMEAFTGLFFETYFRRVREIFKKYDKNHMLIGCRWQPSTANNKQLCGIAGKYLDLISLNYYTYHFDKKYLKRIYEWCGKKAMFLSEFYWSSSSDSGVGAFKDVSSQKERGLAYRNYVEQAVALGYVVGIEWFTLIDQAVMGVFYSRYDGERANTGLISVTDRPWKAMLGEMVKTNYDIYKLEFEGKKPFIFDDPRFTGLGRGIQKIHIARIPNAVKIDGERTDWPGLPGELISGTRLVEGADAGELEANFRLGYDNKNLYIYVEVTDNTPMQNKQTNALWRGDGLEVFIGPEKINESGKLKFGDHQLLIGAGKPEGQFRAVNAPKQFKCKIVVVPRVDGKGYVIETAIPFSGLGFKPEPGKEILFDLAVDNSHDGKGRKAQIMWNGIARNSSDRSAWGRAVFGK